MIRVVKAGLKYLTQKEYRFQYNAGKGHYDSMPDEEYLSKLYEAKFGKKLDLKEPKTFNEKLQWLKLHDRKEKYTTMVDKYAVKKLIAEKIGKEHVVPTYGVWDNISQIDLNKLPSQFVLKTTHGCGGMIICKDKSQLDLKKDGKVLLRGLKRNYYYHVREWPYKNVQPRILAEKYLENDSNAALIVYKVFNFNGIPKIIQVIQGDKTKNETIDYFDTEWNLLNLHQNYPNSQYHLPKPKELNEMLKLSSICSTHFPFLRTDWYIVGGQIYFSEFTFYSDAGMEPFYPEEWDLKLGEWIELPDKEATT